jgi:hypothetical protein
MVSQVHILCFVYLALLKNHEQQSKTQVFPYRFFFRDHGASRLDYRLEES